MRRFNYQPILDSIKAVTVYLKSTRRGIHGVRPIPIHLLSLATYPSDPKSQLTSRRLKFLVNSKST